MDLDFCVEIALWTKNEKKYYDDERSATKFDNAKGKTLLFENVAGWMTILLEFLGPLQSLELVTLDNQKFKTEK